MFHSQINVLAGGPKKDPERKGLTAQGRPSCPVVAIVSPFLWFLNKTIPVGPQDHGTSPLHKYQISVEASRRYRDMLISQSDAEEVEVARGSPLFLQNTPPV